MSKFAQVLTDIAKTIYPIVTLEEQTNLIDIIPHLATATEFSQYLPPDDDKIWCCAGLARFYRTQSQLNKAEFWYQKSLDISEQQLKANHPTIATSLNNLAIFYYSMDRYSEAESLYIKSLDASDLWGQKPDFSEEVGFLGVLVASNG